MGRYSYITDLPPQVREVLSVPRQQQWIDAYHTELSENGDEAAAYNAGWRVVLADVFAGEVDPERLPSDLPASFENAPAAVTSDGKTVHITINAAEQKTPAKLESCVMDLYGSSDFKKKYPDDKERKSHAFAICRSNLKMAESYSFVGDLTGLEFAEDSNQTWVQMLPLGTWTHPIHGAIDLTQERLQRFADNVNNNVRGQQLDIDYEHKESVQGGKAAGWVTRAEVRSDGLWGLVEWTPSAKKSLQDGEYKYFSPEFQDEWVHPQTDEVYQDVLFGGALTNRPFLKGILPINLSEIISARDISQKTRDKAPKGSFAGKGTSFPILKPEDVSAAAHSLGRAGSDNLSADQIKANIIRIAYAKGPSFVAKLPDDWKRKKASEEGSMDEFLKGLAALLGYDIEAPAEGTDGVSESQQKALDDVKALSEAGRKTLDEKNKAKQFAEDYPEEAKRLADLAERDRKNSARIKLDEIKHISETKTGLPPKLHKQFVDFRLELPEDKVAKFDELVTEMVKTPPVDYSERGSSEVSEENENTFEGKLKALQEQAVKDNKPFKMDEAIKQVTQENPDLAAEWRSRTRKQAGGE